MIDMSACVEVSAVCDRHKGSMHGGNGCMYSMCLDIHHLLSDICMLRSPRAWELQS